MATSDNFCLKWNDFQKNMTAFFKEIRNDFCDVTLVSKGNKKIEAHKIILAASSNFFRDIFRQNPHPNPLLYMGGIKDNQLSAVMDFMYHGEANVAQEDLDDFLMVAEELQIKGLAGTEKSRSDIEKELKINHNEKQRKKSINPINIPFIPKQEPEEPTNCVENRWQNDQNVKQRNNSKVFKKIYFAPNKEIAISDTNVIDQTREDVSYIDEHLAETIKLEDDISDTDVIDQIVVGDLVAYDDVKETKISTNEEQLGETINVMMNKVEGNWRCNQCGKTDKSSSNLKKHIEAKHTEGVSHSCNQCMKQFRSKNSLYKHTSMHHK